MTGAINIILLCTTHENGIYRGKGVRKLSEKLIINIGRKFGSEGHEIGRELAERLGIQIYDKDLLYKVAQRHGYEANTLAEADERVSSHFLQPYFLSGENLNDKLFQMQSELIREIADRESCVIVGRLADYILKDGYKCLNVFIYAPFDFRVGIIQKKHHLTIEDARKLVKKMDAARNNYYHYYSNGNWEEKDGKDLMLNREKFTITQCANILETMIKNINPDFSK